MRVLLIVAAVSCLCAGPASAQSADANVYTADAQRQYQYIQGLVMRAAEKVGPDLYAFKPTPAVRSLGAVLGHIADANMLLCGVASGKPTDFDKIMKDLSLVQIHEKKTDKAQLVAALKESSAYCDSVFAQLNDTTGRDQVAWFGGQKMTKLMVLAMSSSHAWEHYGNLVTYMRLKDIVPPSSEQ
jgi:uncharacterized damage-inducible protein DinB